MLSAYANLFVRFLTQSWEEINRGPLGGVLRPPVFQISESGRQLGSWSAGTRTLAISAKLLMNHASHEVLDVLRHEMAHQYADEVLGASGQGETAHGQAFRRACRLLGIDHHASMRPNSEPPPILVRIRKLLALAESHNEHEASLAMARARELMDKYELELGETTPDFCYLYLGLPRKQRAAIDQMIATALVRFFNIKVIWVPSRMLLDESNVWLLEACGTPTHLEVAEYVYDFLRCELEILWLRYRQRNFHVKGKSLKREYQLGVMRGFIHKLTEVQEPQSPGRELVLLRQAQLLNFFQQRHPQLRSGGRLSYRETDTYKAGFAKGRELEIRKGVKRGKATQTIDRGLLLD